MKSFLRTVIPPALFMAGILMVVCGIPYGFLLCLASVLLCGQKLQPCLYAFPSNCEGRLITVSKSTGCSLSAATVRPWTTDDLEGAALKEIGFDREYGRLREARIAGYRETTLQELVMSRVTNMKSLVTRVNVKGNPSVVDPFIKMRQKRNINIQYWNVTAGAPNPSAGTGDTPAHAIDLTVTNQTGTFATNLPNIQNYFLPGRVLFVDYKSAANAAIHVQYTILGATASGAGAKVTVVPNYTADGWAALAAGDKLKYQIGGAGGGAAEAGTGCYIGANSVSDYESYKEMDQALNPNSILQFPIQTSRIVWEYTDEYLRFLNNPNMGEYFRSFWQTPIADQRMQHQKLYDDELMHSVFFGQRENELQTPTTFMQMPTINDPANYNCPIEFKTRAEGIQTQLINCGRYLDLAGAALNLDDIFNRLYLIKRAREADSTNVESIDLMMDRGTAGLFEKAMIAFYQKYYRQTDVRFTEAGSVVDNNRQVLFKYKTYDLPAEFGNFRINVFTHTFFDDRLGAFAGNSIHRMMWVIDWSDFYMGVIGTNSRMTKTNPNDELYRYVIKLNSKYVSLNSMTWTAVLEDPNRHLIVRNFSAACPKVTVAGCDVTVSEPA